MRRPSPTISRWDGWRSAKIPRKSKRLPQSGAEHVIERLPQKYQQVFGSRFDGAVDLSGGEWQRMALARAYPRNAQLLIPDEPTAALDARSENEIFQQLTDLTAGKMSLLISHRFSTVRMVDRILVIGNGAIEEQGSHEELMDAGRRYAEMFDLAGGPLSIAPAIQAIRSARALKS